MLFPMWCIDFVSEINMGDQGGICRGEAGKLPPHWIWPSLPLVCLKTRWNGKGDGRKRGKGRVGETTCLTSPPHTGFCLKYHPVGDDDDDEILAVRTICSTLYETVSRNILALQFWTFDTVASSLCCWCVDAAMTLQSQCLLPFYRV